MNYHLFQELLKKITDKEEFSEGAYNIRKNGEGFVRKTTENVDIVSKKDKPGIDIIVKENTKKEFTYILLNKPIGVVTTADDQFDRETVLDLVKVKTRVVPVGRLDMYTSGALILTDDWEFIYKVTNPKHEINKTTIPITINTKNNYSKNNCHNSFAYRHKITFQVNF